MLISETANSQSSVVRPGDPDWDEAQLRSTC